jgi:uncharacterized integral membrane protein
MSNPDPRAAGSPADPLSVGLGPPATEPTSGPSTSPGTASGGPARSSEPRRERHTGRTIGRSLALALLIFVTVVLVLFVMFNGQTVQISLVFGEVEAPLVLALLIGAVLGGLLVWLAGLVRRARRRSR